MRGLALVLLAACGPRGDSVPPTRSAEGSAVEVGAVEVDGVVYAFSHDHVQLLRAGAPVGRAAQPTPAGTAASWTAAASLAAPDGRRWAVGLAGGALWRVTPAGEIEPVGARLGLGETQVLAVAGAGAAFAIGLVDGFALSRDGLHLMRFAGAPSSAVGVSATRVAIGHAEDLEVIDLAAETEVRLPIAGATMVAFRNPDAAHPQLVVSAPDGVYEEAGARLVRIPSASPSPRVVVSGARVWWLDGGQLSEWAGERVRPTEVRDAHAIFASPLGDVFVVRRGGLSRYPADGTDVDARWQSDVVPIFQRVCARCHKPGGAADYDLTPLATWVTDRAEIARRVVDAQTMPPAGTPLSAADRATLAGWLRP